MLIIIRHKIRKFFRKKFFAIKKWFQTKFVCFFKGHEYVFDYEYQPRYVKKHKVKMRYDIYKFQKCERCGKIIRRHKIENALELGTFRNKYLELTGYDFYIKKYTQI